MRTDRKLSVYESLIENIKRDISLGIIAADEKLPSCRETAMKLGINPNTVQRAYSELEAQGIIYTVPKKGVYCRGASPLKAILHAQPLDRDSRSSDLNDAKEIITRLKNAGHTRRRLIEIIDEVFKDD